MQRAAYGSWPSPLDIEAVVADSLRLAEARVDGADRYWIEGRPGEGGRCVLMRHSGAGAIGEMLPPACSVRTRVHEYGGGAYAVAGARLCFVHDADQCVYALRDGAARRLTAPDARRYGDLVIDPARTRVLCVCEDHSAPGEPVTRLVAIDLRDGDVCTLAQGADFYAAPAVSPDGRQLAWIEWQHPYMPWDRTTLKVATLDEHGRPRDVYALTGTREAAQQPRWHLDGALYFISDRDDWWNLYRWDGAATAAVTRVCAELAGPSWTLGTSSYALAGDSVLCVVTRDGGTRLERARLADGALVPLPLPFTDCESVHVAGAHAVLIAATPQRARAVVELDLRRGDYRELRASSNVALDPDDVSAAQALSFATGADETAHAYYYAPRNRACRAPPGERPPLIVKCHGGPTSSAGAALDLRTQYWTSRGFALLDVNYRGSTGYGRSYRERLYGHWGEVDVEDCVCAAAHAAASGLADGARAVITGSSSGGYTVLCALVWYAAFRAGASYYGIGDLALLVDDTHKFESRYTQRLVGGDPALWRARSPLHHVERIEVPVLFLQGLDDKVVPPAQSQRMAAALRARGVPVAYLEFAGESHGFRRADTLRRALAAELTFYARVLGLTPAEALEPVSIEPPLP